MCAGDIEAGACLRVHEFRSLLDFKWVFKGILGEVCFGFEYFGVGKVGKLTEFCVYRETKPRQFQFRVLFVLCSFVGLRTLNKHEIHSPYDIYVNSLDWGCLVCFFRTSVGLGGRWVVHAPVNSCVLCCRREIQALRLEPPLIVSLLE
jgi:hypothetical protein